MKLIVGLGNPGKEYEKTRHNTGFMALDSFAQKNGVVIDKKKYNGLYADATINGEKIILLKPQTFMNLSGECVRKYVDYFKIKVEDILVINDDLDLEVGRLRLRRNGDSAGHNGLKNIELNLGTKDFKRLKIGIYNYELWTMDYELTQIPFPSSKASCSLGLPSISRGSFTPPQKSVPARRLLG